LLGQRPIVVTSQQYRVGIVQLFQHPPGRLLVEVGLTQRVDEVSADVAQHVIEETGLLVDVAVVGNTPLQQPPATQE
jgi:hypothetical protein